MRKRDIKKRLQRLFALLLTVAMTVPFCTPVLAEGGSGEDAGTTDLTQLEIGQILQPGDKLSYKHMEHQLEVILFYTDHGDTSFASNECSYSGKESNGSFVVADYNAATFNTDLENLQLSTDDFGGWKVMDSDYYNNSCGTFRRTILMAVTKKEALDSSAYEAPESIITTYTSPSPLPSGGSLKLYGFDQNTGKALQKDPDGNLIAHFGDIIYACTTPVEGYASFITIEDGSGNRPRYYKQMTNWSYSNYNNKETYYYNMFYTPKRYTFLPEEVDGFTVFAVTEKRILVSAEYNQTNQTHTIAYKDHNTSNPTTLNTDGPIPTNGSVPLWTPDQGQVDGQNVIGWICDGYRGFGDTYRVRENLNLYPRYELPSDYKLTTAPGCRTTYFSPVDKYLDHMLEAKTANNNTKIVLEADLAAIPAGQTVTGYSVTIGGKTQNYKFPTGFLKGTMEAMLPYNGDPNHLFLQSVITGDAGISLLYSEDTPRDFVIDVSSGSCRQTPGEQGSDTEFTWGALYFPTNAIDQTDAMDFTGLKFINNYPYYFYEFTKIGCCNRYRLFDLNKDGEWDLSGRVNNYRKTIDWKLLEGAKKLTQDSYSIPLKREGYENLVFKIKADASPDPVVDPKQDDKEPPKNEPKTETPAKAPAVGDTIADEKTDNTYRITAVGNDNTVTVTGVKVTKKTVVIPDTVLFNGVSFKVTAIDAKVLSVKGIKILDIGANVKKIPVNTFKKCKNLKIVRIRNKKKVYNLTKKYFKGVKGKLKFYVPKNLLGKYKQMVKKQKFSGKVQLKKLK